VTSVELVEAAVAWIERADRSINAVVVKDFDRARGAAIEADRTRTSGIDRPLLGLPITVKEAFDVAGLPTSWGLPGMHEAAASDSVVVARLRSAGAIILGKTNVATMLGDWQTANPRFGVTNNPWDTSRTPGGSSGGSAAAVAAGMTALEFGSDLAGSLRIPAAFCGVFAHRPSHGLVPMRGFAPPMAPRTPLAQPIDQATVGPFARHAGDLRLALDVIGGPDVPDATAYRLALPPPRHSSLKDFRVLILDTHAMVPTSDDIRTALAGLASRLEREGCRVGRAVGEIPDMKDSTETFAALLHAVMGADMPENDYAAAARPATMSHREWYGSIAINCAPSGARRSSAGMWSFARLRPPLRFSTTTVRSTSESSTSTAHLSATRRRRSGPPSRRRADCP
jgi:amidase